MSVKHQVALFSALNLLVAAASAQSIFDKAPKEQVERKEQAKPAAAALATLVGAAAPATAAVAPAPVAPKAAQVTIKDLADKQAASLAAEAGKTVSPAVAQTVAAPAPAAGPILPAPIVGELKPVSPIPVSMSNPPKPLKSQGKAAPAPRPARPYLAAVVGFAGKELAEIHVGDHIRTLKAGDSIEQWKVTNILDGRLMLSATTSKKVKKKLITETKERVLSVGDTL